MFDEQARYLRLIFDLLDAGASTVVYEAATSLTALTANPVAVKAAAGKLVELSIKEADNNVKLIVLDRVEELHTQHEGVLDDLAMEILRGLSSTDIDVRRKALGIAMKMVSSKNVEEIVMLLKKELAKTVDEQYEKVKSGSIRILELTFANISDLEYRISPTPHPIDTSVCCQLLRNCRKCC